MKTSEFIKYVSKEWLANFEKDGEVINIVGIMKVHTNCSLIEFEERVAAGTNHFRLIEKAIEYTETPLEERQEEKKYRLNTPFNQERNPCLNFHTKQNRYFISTPTESEQHQTSFTQKEIDQMPFDTKFFVKEQV